MDNYRHERFAALGRSLKIRIASALWQANARARGRGSSRQAAPVRVAVCAWFALRELRGLWAGNAKGIYFRQVPARIPRQQHGSWLARFDSNVNWQAGRQLATDNQVWQKLGSSGSRCNGRSGEPSRTRPTRFPASRSARGTYRQPRFAPKTGRAKSWRTPCVVYDS